MHTEVEWFCLCLVGRGDRIEYDRMWISRIEHVQHIDFEMQSWDFCSWKLASLGLWLFILSSNAGSIWFFVITVWFYLPKWQLYFTLFHVFNVLCEKSAKLYRTLKNMKWNECSLDKTALSTWNKARTRFILGAESFNDKLTGCDVYNYWMYIYVEFH